MNKININIPLLLTIIATALLTLQLKSCFSSKPVNETEIVNREKIKYLEKDRQRDSVEKMQLIVEKDVLVKFLKERDSLLAVSYIKNQTVYKPIYENLKNIGTRFDRMADNDDSLLAAGKKRYD